MGSLIILHVIYETVLVFFRLDHSQLTSVLQRFLDQGPVGHSAPHVQIPAQVTSLEIQALHWAITVGQVLPHDFRGEMWHSWTEENARRVALCLQNWGKMSGLDFVNEMLGCNLDGASLVCTKYAHMPPYAWNISYMFMCWHWNTYTSWRCYILFRVAYLHNYSSCISHSKLWKNVDSFHFQLWHYLLDSSGFSSQRCTSAGFHAARICSNHPLFGNGGKRTSMNKFPSNP